MVLFGLNWNKLNRDYGLLKNEIMLELEKRLKNLQKNGWEQIYIREVLLLIQQIQHEKKVNKL